MHANTSDTTRGAPFARIRLIHMLAPVAVSIGLVIGGYSALTVLADEIASTVKPLQTETAPGLEPVTTPVAATTIAAN